MYIFLYIRVCVCVFVYLFTHKDTNSVNKQSLYVHFVLKELEVYIDVYIELYTTFGCFIAHVSLLFNTGWVT